MYAEGYSASEFGIEGNPFIIRFKTKIDKATKFHESLY